MDYLQYSFLESLEYEVLNLVINGLPSIPKKYISVAQASSSFKPCYKWITFNTIVKLKI